VSETPAERSLRARLAAHTLHAHYDSRELTKKARAAGPGQLAYFLRQVDLALPEPERQRRAEHLRRAHFQRLALASAKARRKSPHKRQRRPLARPALPKPEMSAPMPPHRSSDLRSRRVRRFALRWRRPTVTTDEALEVLEAFAARHGGDERAVLGELIALLLERNAGAS
jgi:hypothetical protein